MRSRCGYFRTELAVERKADASPVTLADREAEERAVAVLRAAFPDCGVLGEEYGEQGAQDRRWIIDPIDGTRSFIRGIPFFATLIALEEDGEITTGVIYAPALDDLLYAQKGQGAFDRGGRLRVSTIDTLAPLDARLRRRQRPAPRRLLAGLRAAGRRGPAASAPTATTSATPSSPAARPRR